MVAGLSHDQQRTYDAVFQHPISANIERRKIRSMFQALGEVTEEHNGNLRIDRNGHTLVLHPAHSMHPAGFDEVMQIRHFLQTSDGVDAETLTPRILLLVLVEHRQTLIYRAVLKGSLPESIIAYDPRGIESHIHNVHSHGGGLGGPVGASYYKEIAESLQGADEILMFGTGSGGASALDKLLAELQLSQPDLFAKVAGALAVEEKHVSEELLLSKARAFYHVSPTSD